MFYDLHESVVFSVARELTNEVETDVRQIFTNKIPIMVLLMAFGRYAKVSVRVRSPCVGNVIRWGTITSELYLRTSSVLVITRTSLFSIR